MPNDFPITSPLGATVVRDAADQSERELRHLLRAGAFVDDAVPAVRRATRVLRECIAELDRLRRAQRPGGR